MRPRANLDALYPASDSPWIAVPAGLLTRASSMIKAAHVHKSSAIVERMKIMSWNMAAAMGSSATKQEAAWRWLNEQDVDVALLQEAVLIEEYARSWGSTIFRGKWDKNWGCAVLVRSGSYERWEPSASQPWLQRVRGAATVARPTSGQGLWFASVHSDSSSFEATNRRYPTTYGDLPDRDGILRCSTKEMWEIEVIAHELSPVLASGPFVLGGDLNSSLLFDKNEDGQEARLFKNLASQGFIDTRSRHSESEIQTFFKPRTRPFQLDHVYADEATESNVVRWEVLAHVARDLTLSDHAPVLVELDA